MTCRLRVLFCLALACGPGEPPEDPGSDPEETTVQVLSAPGEYPAASELTAPQGAALVTENVVVDTPDEYRTHRGLERYGADGVRAWSAITLYAGDLIAHSEAAGKLARLSGGTWTEYSGTYNAPAGTRMSFEQASGALFFTTTEGLYRLDGPTATPVPAGIAPGLPGTGSLTGSSGYLTQGFGVAYRHSWALNATAEGEERLLEGAPSPRLLVTNPLATGASRDVVVSWPIPEGLPAGAFNRTYRSDALPETIIPLDEVRQVYERVPTEAELAAGTFTFTDTTPDTVKGAGAYFASNTGEGIAQSNYQPPLVHGLTMFNGSVFGVTVTGVQRLTLNILGVDGITLGQTLTFEGEDGSYGAGYMASAGEDIGNQQFQLFTGGTPAQNIAQTVDSLCRVINGHIDGDFYAFPLDTDGTNPGGLVLQRRTLGQVPFIAWTNGNGQAFAPALRERRQAATATRATGFVTLDIDNTGVVPHSFNVDDQVTIVYLSGEDPDFPPGVKTIVAVTSNNITYVEAGPNVGPVVSTALILSSDEYPLSSSGTALNTYQWSKQDEPDHWPLANLATVGGATDTLYWGARLDRYFFLGSEAGLFRLGGNAREGFFLVDGGAWDSTVSFIGRRNVAVLNGRGYALSNKGIVSWSEAGKPVPVDSPIQTEVRALIATMPTVLEEHGFMFADEVNGRVYVCLPTAPGDTSAKRCHILNARTSAWTRLTDTFPGAEEGLVSGLAADGQQYLLTPEASTHEGYVLASRNTATDSDYQGPLGEAVPSSVTYLPFLAGEPGRFKQFTWTRVFMAQPTTRIELCFSTDWAPDPECQTLPDVDPIRTGYEPVVSPVRGVAWRTIADLFHQRGRALTTKVSQSEAGEPMRLLGVEIKHRAYGSGQ